MVSFGIFAHNASADTVVANIPLDGCSAAAIAFNPSNNYMYVADGLSRGTPQCQTLSVISNTTKIATIQLSAPPVAIAFNPSNNYMYVTGDFASKGYTTYNNGTTKCTSGCNDMVAVISGTNVVATIHLGPVDPIDLAYNPSNHDIYVSENGGGFGNIVAVISNTTKIADLTVGHINSTNWGVGPRGLSFNPSNNYMYVGLNTAQTTNPPTQYSAVSVISNLNVIATVPVKSQPDVLAYNPYNHYVYVVEVGTHATAVISNTTNIGEIQTGLNDQAEGIAVANNYAYTANIGTNTVSVILNTTNIANVVVGPSPWGLVFDPSIKKMYVSQGCHGSDAINQNTLSIISNTTKVNSVVVGYCPTNLAFDPSNNYVYVTNLGEWVNGIVSSTIGISVIKPDNNTQTVPAMPTGLTATGQLSQISLSWNAPTDDGHSVIIGYKIERSTDLGSTWSTIVSNTNQTVTTYSDMNVLPTTTYTYRVSTINYVGTSAPSITTSATTVSGTTVPASPTELTATAVSASQINLSWTSPSSNGASPVTGYKIERSNSTGVWSTIVPNTGSTATIYADTGLDSKTTYTYRVSAINLVGTSSPSNTVSATTS